MPIQKKISQLGLARQTAKDSTAANPTYAFGLKSGRVSAVDLSQERDELTVASGRITPHGFRSGAVPAVDVTTRAWPKSLPLAIYAALGGISTTGAGPYTHTITPADSLPYLGAFGRLGSFYDRVDNCFVDELAISWDGPSPLEAALRLVGTDLTVLGGAWTATTDDTTNAYLRPVGGTFLLDVDGGSPAAAKIKAGTIRVVNGVEPIVYADSVVADDVWVNEQVTTVEFTIVPENLNIWREAILGAAANTTLAATPTFGSFDITFTEGAHSLQVVSTRVMFACEFPESDAGGGPVELQLVGEILKPSGATAAITATAINDVASYTS